METCIPLSALPTLARQYIFKRCKAAALRNLALCSKWVHDEVIPILWSKLEISWYKIAENTAMLGEGQSTANMRYVSRLRIHGDYHGELAVEEKNRGYLSYGFGYLPQCCDPQGMKNLTIWDFMPAEGLRLLCEKFRICDILRCTMYTQIGTIFRGYLRQ